MRLRTFDAGNRSDPRGGYVIFAVLIVIVVLSLVAYRFTESMTSEYRASVRVNDDAQVRMAAVSGLHYVAAMLADPNTFSQQLDGNPFDNQSVFGEVPVTPSSGPTNPGRVPCFSIRSVVVNADGSYSQQFGVIDEGSKLNINALIGLDPTGTLLDNALLSILNTIMPGNGNNQNIADAITDWVDADDTPRANGAESSYYQGLSPAYNAKNGPLNSLDELLMVQGVTPYILYGGDTNRNGIQDSGEIDNTRGLADYITVYGRELNISSTGTARIYLNGDDLTTMSSQLQTAVGNDLATYIIASKLFTPTPVSSSTSATVTASSSGGKMSLTVTPQQTVTATTDQLQAAVATKLLATSSSGTRIQSLMDLIGTQIALPAAPGAKPTDPKVVAYSPLNDPTQLSTLLPLLMDQTTVKQAIELVPRLNVNTAPVNVLMTLPNMTTDLVTTLTNQRLNNDATDPGTISLAWLLTNNILTPTQFKALEAYITGTTMIYRVQSIGYFQGTTQDPNTGNATGPMARMEAVIDTNQGAPRFLFIRDLADLEHPRGFFPIAQ